MFRVLNIVITILIAIVYLCGTIIDIMVGEFHLLSYYKLAIPIVIIYLLILTFYYLMSDRIKNTIHTILIFGGIHLVLPLPFYFIMTFII